MILHIFLAFFKENLYLCRGKTEQDVRDAIHSHGADDDYHGDADCLPASQDDGRQRAKPFSLADGRRYVTGGYPVYATVHLWLP